MRYRCYCMLALLVAHGSAIGSAQEPTAGDLGKARAGNLPAARDASATDSWSGGDSRRQVLAREVNIEPGDTFYVEWLSDISGAERVGIQVTSLSDWRSSLTNVRIGVAFAAPGDWYIISSVILGKSFYYTDHGAATVPVYGPRMKLAVTNDGTTALRITELVAYLVVH